MSVSASIDMKLVGHKSDYVSSVIIIKELLRFGWTINHRKKMSYLPIGDNGMFSWVDENVCLESLMKTLEKKEKLGELIGVGMVWQDTNTGGEFLLYTDDQLNGQLSVILSMNRKILVETNGLKITDVNWYLTKLLPPLNHGDFCIESFSYEEHE